MFSSLWFGPIMDSIGNENKEMMDAVLSRSTSWVNWVVEEVALNEHIAALCICNYRKYPDYTKLHEFCDIFIAETRFQINVSERDRDKLMLAYSNMQASRTTLDPVVKPLLLNMVDYYGRWKVRKADVKGTISKHHITEYRKNVAMLKAAGFPVAHMGISRYFSF